MYLINAWSFKITLAVPLTILFQTGLKATSAIVGSAFAYTHTHKGDDALEKNKDDAGRKDDQQGWKGNNGGQDMDKIHEETIHQMMIWKQKTFSAFINNFLFQQNKNFLIKYITPDYIVC